MSEKTIKNIWLHLLKGILITLFGLIALFRPDTALVTLVKLFGVFAVAGGIVTLIFSSGNRHLPGNNFWMAEGIIDILIGIILLIFPEGTVKLFVILIALWAIIMGIFQLTTYARYKHFLFNKHLQLVSGLITIAIGLILLFNPFEGGMIVVVFIGFLAIFFGVNTIINSLK